jgi:hypothetical protein
MLAFSMMSTCVSCEGIEVLVGGVVLRHAAVLLSYRGLFGSTSTTIP